MNSADLVCFVGTETGGMTTHFWAVPKIGIPAIQIDIEPETLGRNYPLEAGVLGDAKTVLARMLGADRPSTAGKPATPGSRNRGICREWYEKYSPLLESDAGADPARAHLRAS